MNASESSVRHPRSPDLTVKYPYISIDGGHWALETNLAEIVALARDFLGRVHP